MPDMEKLRENLEKRGFAAVYFPTAREAADYLDGRLDGRTIAFGGSMTVREMGLYERLAVHNQTFWHWDPERPAPLADGMGTEVYITSVNGAAETGELVNIDGAGNRVASTVYGHQAVYFVVGSNKIVPDYDSALWRARNIAAPKNAQRMGLKTPCAVRGDRCYDCKSPDRICQVLTVLWGKPMTLPLMEVILVDEALGY